MKPHLVICTVQEQRVSPKDVPKLEAGIKKLYNSWFNSAPIVIWIEIPAGQAFSDYQPSKASVVLASVPDGFPAEKRTQFLHQFTKTWAAAINCTLFDILCTAADLNVVYSYMAAQRGRVRPWARPVFSLKLATRFIVSKLTKGFFGANLNF